MDNHWNNATRGTYPESHVIRWVKHNVPKGGRVLDMGCGNGNHWRMLIHEGYNAYGIDGVDFGLNEECKKAPRIYIQDVTEKLPFIDNVFDAVIDCRCLTHIPMDKIPSVLSEIKRVMKKSALFYSEVFGDKTSNLGDVGFVVLWDINRIYNLWNPIIVDSCLETYKPKTIHTYRLTVKKE